MAEEDILFDAFILCVLNEPDEYLRDILKNRADDFKRECKEGIQTHGLEGYLDIVLKTIYGDRTEQFKQFSRQNATEACPYIRTLAHTVGTSLYFIARHSIRDQLRGSGYEAFDRKNSKRKESKTVSREKERLKLSAVSDVSGESGERGVSGESDKKEEEEKVQEVDVVVDDIQTKM